MHFISLNLKKGFGRARAPFIFSTILLFFLTISASHATNYESAANGYWPVKKVWKNEIVAPIGIHNRDTIRINHQVDASNITITNGGTLIITGELSAQNISLNGNTSKIIVESGATLNAATVAGNNSQNIVYKNVAPLPVTLVAFKLQAAPAGRTSNTLVWQTASELNNDYFSVEKSADGKTFTEAGRVAGKNLANGATYSFEDKQVAAQTYYRLKQVDFDGKATYSTIIVATVLPKASLTGNKLVFGQNFSGQVRVVTMAGQEVKSLSLQNAPAYELPQQLRGLYMLILESGAAATSQRIML
jgi:hypothetical protein